MLLFISITIVPISIILVPKNKKNVYTEHSKVG